MTNFTARTDRTLVRAEARSTRYVLLQATAPKKRAAKQPKRPPVNVAFVLDRSGSMAGTKLALAKYAVERALTGLAPKDRFAIVTYDDRIETVVGSCLATSANKTKALLRLQDVDARGSTDLHGGWTAGAHALKAHLTPDGVNRCLLLTDGLANVGLTDAPALAAYAADLRASGIGTSTFIHGAWTLPTNRRSPFANVTDPLAMYPSRSQMLSAGRSYAVNESPRLASTAEPHRFTSAMTMSHRSPAQAGGVAS